MPRFLRALVEVESVEVLEGRIGELPLLRRQSDPDLRSSQVMVIATKKQTIIVFGGWSGLPQQLKVFRMKRKTRTRLPEIDHAAVDAGDVALNVTSPYHHYREHLVLT